MPAIALCTLLPECAGVNLFQAARAEHVKLATVRKYLGRHFNQDGPGKRWTASKSDRLSAHLNVLTPQGLTVALERIP